MSTVIRNMVCIVCPMGCRLTLVKDESMENGIKVLHNQCKRGSQYAIEELTAPMRSLTSTVVIKHGFLNRLPVKTSGAIPKSQLTDAMAVIDSLMVEAPVKCGQILVKNLLGAEVDLVATRSMKKI